MNPLMNPSPRVNAKKLPSSAKRVGEFSRKTSSVEFRVLDDSHLRAGTNRARRIKIKTSRLAYSAKAISMSTHRASLNGDGESREGEESRPTGCIEQDQARASRTGSGREKANGLIAASVGQPARWPRCDLSRRRVETRSRARARARKYHRCTDIPVSGIFRWEEKSYHRSSSVA